MRNVYIVGSNMPGYLPDSDPYIVGTRRAAVMASRDEAQRALEADYDLDPADRGRVTGRAGDYWYVPAPGGGAQYHYWIHKASAELVTIEATPDARSTSFGIAPRCASCERALEAGERVYIVDTADAYICRDCLA